MRNKLIFLTLLLILPLLSAAQKKKQYQIGAIGFYNFENLFDTEDDPVINDDDFTPQGDNLYTDVIYQEKLSHLARVVSELATEKTPDGVALLGVAEIENRKVLEDFVIQPKIIDRNYQIVHFDSPDRRGIDVALLYQPKYFKVIESKALPVMLYRADSSRIYTRDILYVAGEFNGEPMHVFVNHWPSRRGGQAASQPLRNAAAFVCKQVCDSLLNVDPLAKIMIMGDLNDDPVSPSVKSVLDAKGKKEQVRKKGFYNPLYTYFKKGIGTLAYQDAWSLFDQIIVSNGLISKQAEGYHYYQAVVHNPKYLVQKTGHFKGYPFRTFSGNAYLGGYSDHFPVYIYVIKEISE
ncbi:MAG: endonuclease [Saprospiraceae bacterium]|nr:MAG: endonuclease [Saprospiraceae bacterium]